LRTAIHLLLTFLLFSIRFIFYIKHYKKNSNNNRTEDSPAWKGSDGSLSNSLTKLIQCNIAVKIHGTRASRFAYPPPRSVNHLLSVGPTSPRLGRRAQISIDCSAKPRSAVSEPGLEKPRLLKNFSRFLGFSNFILCRALLQYARNPTAALTTNTLIKLLI